ncbi:MAG: hypothetical protein IJU56_04365 [Clostridia bacterium]|nr:hypothetical protein [Clostridia bacterium]
MRQKRSSVSAERLFFFKCGAGLFLFFALIFLLLQNAKAAQSGVAAGVHLCLQTLIPSMLPLLILSAFFQRSALGAAASGMLEAPTRLLLGVSGAGAGVVLFALLGGFPAGASSIRAAVETRSLSRRDGKVLQLLCFCPSAAFTVGAVGAGMLGEIKIGLMLEISVLLPLLLLALPLRFLVPANAVPPGKKRAFLSPAQAFVDAVEEGAKAMLSVCAFVCLFSALPPVLSAFSFPEKLRVWVLALPELTGGIYGAAKSLSLPALASLLSFGGFCAHCQLLPTLQFLHLSYWKFFLFRLLHALLSAAVCFALCRAFPMLRPVFAQSGAALAPFSASSPAVSVCLCSMCALLLLGSSTIKLEKKKKM